MAYHSVCCRGGPSCECANILRAANRVGTCDSAWHISTARNSFHLSNHHIAFSRMSSSLSRLYLSYISCKSAVEYLVVCFDKRTNPSAVPLPYLASRFFANWYCSPLRNPLQYLHWASQLPCSFHRVERHALDMKWPQSTSRKWRLTPHVKQCTKPLSSLSRRRMYREKTRSTFFISVCLLLANLS